MSIAPSTSKRKRASGAKNQLIHQETLVQYPSKRLNNFLYALVNYRPIRDRYWHYKKSRSGIAFCLVASALGLYAWSVCIPRLWSQESRKLETLQRHERHFTAMSETLKNQLAQQAERPETGLAKLNPAQVIFLSPSVSPLRQPQKTTAAENKPIVGNAPLAY